jgi:Zn-dependent M16 (insulinase) family peptidase
MPTRRHIRKPLHFREEIPGLRLLPVAHCTGMPDCGVTRFCQSLRIESMTFQKYRTKSVPSLQAEVQEYEDPATGARHIHLANNTQEMVFLVGFPTVPDVSDGRAHILEHLALCGSDRYPVRDPFFSMLRRSTAHFMNAMTYSDKTVYPFASTDKADFFNLLDVYLDAAFFPKLDYLDFLQEGWRLGLDGNKLAYHGVVFNEMKGAFADPVRALDGGISAHLLKGTTYEVESGGDPLDIPSLTHEALKKFHATHYHPSQAVFMTAGGVDPREIQKVIEDRILSKLSGRSPRKMPELAPYWPEPKSATIAIPANEYGVQIAWLMGESVDPTAYYHVQLLESGLLGNSSAPLTRAMESAGFGRPSSMNGADAGGRQIVFHLGMEGLTEEQVGDARQRIWAALEEAAKEGVPHSLLQAALRDIRFGQREISSGRTPDAMRRLLRAIPHEMYGGDVMNGFEDDGVLEQLQEKIADPEFFKGLVRALLDSTTRLDATVTPDDAYFQNRKKIEDERLAALEASMSDDEKERLRTEAAALLERQRRHVNNDVLPRIRPQDVSPLPRPIFLLPKAENNVIAVSIPSNNISYARVMYDVSGFEKAAWPWLQLYIDVLAELGVGARSYEEADARRHDQVPHFDASLHVTQPQDASKPLRIQVDFYVKALREENEAIASVLSESISAARFDEKERLAFLIDSMVQERRNDLSDEGDFYARLAVAAPLSSMRNFENTVKGAAALSFFSQLHEMSQSDEGLEDISRQLTQLHHRIVRQTPTILTAGMDRDARTLADLLKLPRASDKEKHAAPPAAAQLALSNTALHAPAQVNHCFAAWAAPGLAHPDAPAMAVLGEILTNLVLHQALREEGGAYGGQAGYCPTTATFIMMSYRDPRLAATYADFQRAITRVIEGELGQENIEEAIIGVIQDLDKPQTPYAHVLWSWEQQGKGITDAMRQQYRHGVLNCTAERIKAAAAAWLLDKPHSRTAFAGNIDQDLAGLDVADLVKMAN